MAARAMAGAARSRGDRNNTGRVRGARAAWGVAARAMAVGLVAGAAWGLTA